MVLIVIVALFSVISALIYFYAKNLFSYWTQRGVKQLNPVFPVGDILPLVRQQKCFGDFYIDLYKETKHEPFIGIYNLIKPAILVNDPQLAKNIMVRDSSNFIDRGTYANEERDPLSAHLFALSGEKWQFMRTKMSPTFTSGKIKGMFPTMIACADKLEEYIHKTIKTNNAIEVRDLMACFGTDVIASVAFGYEIDSINNKSETFREMGRQIFDMNLKNAFRNASTFLFPSMMEFLKLKSVDDNVEDFFLNLIKSNLAYREKNNVNRRDFLQLMIQLRNMGKIKLTDDWESTNAEESDKTMTVNEVTAQAYVFYLAGFETSSTTMSFCLYELAKHPEVLKKLQLEIDTVMQRHNGVVSYEAIQEMTYLDNCVDETLRKYPPLPVLQRQAKNEYTVPGTKTVIPAGTIMFIPIIGMQRDPDLYADPLKFIPERFTDPSLAETINVAFYPFGDGPRVCIGTRMGKILTKIGLYYTIKNFSIELDRKFHDYHSDMEFSRHSLVLTPTQGINLIVKERR